MFTFPPVLSHSFSFPKVLRYQSVHRSVRTHTIRRSLLLCRISQNLEFSAFSSELLQLSRQFSSVSRDSLLPASLFISLHVPQIRHLLTVCVMLPAGSGFVGPGVFSLHSPFIVLSGLAALAHASFRQHSVGERIRNLEIAGGRTTTTTIFFKKFSTVLMLWRLFLNKTLGMTRLSYWYGIGLAIHRSQVRVPAGHHRVVAFGKLPVCLCHQGL